MNSGFLLFLAMAVYAAAYRLYGRFLQKKFEVDPARRTPAHEFRDGVDFVPARSWWVLFGHHFSSICGAGPIIGPVLACAYWGWGLSLVWIVIGAVFMGAVSDFSSLIMSVKSRGSSVAEISGLEISRNVRLFFSIFLWIALVLVIAVFAIFAAKTFIQEPDAVIPSFGLIPTALLIGWLFYRTRVANWQAAMIGLVILAGLLVLGNRVEVQLSGIAGLSPQTVWILLLLAYCFIASVVPVQVLLQPRDFLASFILFGLVAAGVVCVLITQPRIEAPFFTAWQPAAWKESGPLWPMLFVTIACGAISGFHSLVSSGTTCKQLDSEAHACRIGYGGMLVESLVAVLVLIAVTAGLSQARLGALLKSGGPIAAFGTGYGEMTTLLFGGYGKAFAVLALNAFILTTLDTATRITRYLTAELFGIRNLYLAAIVPVLAGGALALSGRWSVLWPAFGASNQLIAGITLMIAACWLMHRGRRYAFVFVPAVFMLVTTVAALGWQMISALRRVNTAGLAEPDWFFAVLAAVLILLGFSVFYEALRSVRKARA